MKTITIRLPDVEAAMLLEVQKAKKAYRDLQGLLLNQIRQEYARAPGGRASRWLVVSQSNARGMAPDCGGI